jgi:hypothetical protein
LEISISWRELQSSKQHCPINFNESGKLIFFKDEQPEKQLFPRD